MQKNCYFCKKKIGILDITYSIDEKRIPQKICSECEVKKRVLRRHVTGDYDAAYAFFTRYQTEGDSDPLVSEVINEWIQAGEKQQEQIEVELQQQKKECEIEQTLKDFPMTTVHSFEGSRITEYKGIVSGAAVLGTGFIADASAAVSEFFGATSDTLGDKIISARNIATRKMIRNAFEAGGTALIGVSYDMSVMAGNALAVLATGTAVVIEKNTD